MLKVVTINAQLEFKSLQEVFNYADFQAIALKNSVLSEQIALSEKKESEPDDNEKAETSKEEPRHPISVLVKSCVPFSKYFCMTDNYEDYK